MCSLSAARAGERGRERERAKKRTQRNSRAEKKLSTTRRSKMASPPSTDNQENASAPFSEEQCQWLQRLAAQWARPPPSGPSGQPSTSTANSGDSGSGELAWRKTIEYSYRDGRWPTAPVSRRGYQLPITKGRAPDPTPLSGRPNTPPTPAKTSLVGR